MIKTNNHIIILNILAIILFGTFLMYSASSSFAYYKFNQSDTYFLFKHFLWLFLGFIALIILQYINHTFFNKYSKIILIFTWVIMLIPIFINSEKGSIDRWLKVGNFTLLTTSDAAKIGILIFTSSFIDKYHTKINDIKILVKELLLYIFISIAIISYQPDLSTSIIISIIFFSLLFIAGINKKTILIFFSIGSSALLFLLYRFPYQFKRLLVWLGFDENSQSSNSILALANGGLAGTGIGDSSFKYNGFIPEGQTDFILAIIGEELGFIGILLIFFSFTVFLFQGLSISQKCSDRFSMFLSLGLTLNIFFYLIVNSAYVIGLLPTTGLPIPFISYGGSQTIFSLISIGILINISNRNQLTINPKFYYGRT